MIPTFVVMIFMSIAVFADAQTAGLGAWTLDTISQSCFVDGDYELVFVKRDIYKNGSTCGNLVVFTCTDTQNCVSTTQTYTVQIATLCDECPGDIVMSQQFYDTIAPDALTPFSLTYTVTTESAAAATTTTTSAAKTLTRPYNLINHAAAGTL